MGDETDDLAEVVCKGMIRLEDQRTGIVIGTGNFIGVTDPGNTFIFLECLFYFTAGDPGLTGADYVVYDQLDLPEIKTGAFQCPESGIVAGGGGGILCAQEQDRIGSFKGTAGTVPRVAAGIADNIVEISITDNIAQHDSQLIRFNGQSVFMQKRRQQD